MTQTTIESKKIHLMYPNGKFVALDSSSGGYPFEVSITSTSVHNFETVEKAQRYIGHFNREGFTIREVTYTMRY
jgi:hypothetical protein